MKLWSNSKGGSDLFGKGKEIKIMALILIIDDEPQIRSMLKLMLERDGYEVAEAPDGIEGLRVYRQKPADLIITDLIMPNKDGIGMIIELKKEFPELYK